MYHQNIIRIGGFTTSATEIKDLLISWLIITAIFTILFTRSAISAQTIISNFIVSAVTVGAGFLLHEMGHKFMAQRYRCFAEYRADIRMLLFALLISFTGIVFIAPGAVMISGHVDTRKNGIISMMGPLINLLLVPVFFVLSISVSGLFSYGIFINAWLALFNMLPIGNFDGRKVLAWNKIVYASMLIAAVLLLVPQFL